MNKTTPTNKVVDTVDSVTDYVKDGVLYRNAVSSTVMVESSSDLDNLDEYEVGSIAYTAGYGSVWQKDADGTWQEV